AKKIATTFQAYTGNMWAKANAINSAWDDMTWEERRRLMELVFSGFMDDGHRMGVFVEWVDGQERKKHKLWNYRIRGHVVDRKGRRTAIMTFAELKHEGEGVPGGRWQRDLLKVTSLPSS